MRLPTFLLFATILTMTTAAVSASSNATQLPEYAWDSHIHIIDPDRYPLSPDRDYTPKAATVVDATSFQTSRGIAHSVVVLPSVYGTNNTVLLDALESFNGSARGVCVVDPDTIDNSTLAKFHAAGVRGVRVNFGNGGSSDEIIKAVKKNARVAAVHDWVLQLWIPIAIFTDLHDLIPKLGVRVVVDHYGHAIASSRSGNSRDSVDPYKIKGFPEMIDLVRRRLLFVKISAPYQNSLLAPLYQDMRIIAEILMLNGPEMVVYGSDWPHTGSKEGNAAAGGRLFPQEFRKIDDAGLVREVVQWAGSPQQVQRLFVENPRRLWQWYGDETT